MKPAVRNRALFSLFVIVFLFLFPHCSGSDDEDDSASSSPSGDDASDDTIDDDNDFDDSADDESDDSTDDTSDDSSDDSADDTSDDSTDDTSDDTGDDDTAPVCAPPGGGAQTALSAGVAVGDLYAPVGSSMGGYGGRQGPRHPLAIMMGASTGYIDRPNVKAVALDNGAARVVIARITAAGVSRPLYSKVIDRVCKKTGVNLTGALWLSATHTHSGPSHFLPMPPILGGAGVDTWDEGHTNRIADSIAEVVKDAMERLAPATFAAEIVSPFDPTNRWTVDRRCQNNPPSYKEDRLYLARIDSADGTPLAALVSYPVHGTTMMKTVMTSDIPGAVEYGLQKTFSEPVEVIFLQGPTGDTAPNSSPHGHRGQQNMEWYARSIGPSLRSVYDSLAPQSNLDISMAALPLPVSREAIGYADDEFGHVNPITGEFQLWENGAFFCGEETVFGFTDYFSTHGSTIDCNDLSTTLVDGYYGCILPNPLIEPWWTWAGSPTELAALRLGDDLLSLIPGELTSFLSLRLRGGLADALALPEDHIATFGYSNDFQLYLLTEWDWLQGGYETSMNFWGPKYGDWLADQSVLLAQTLYDPDGPQYQPEPPLPDYPWPEFCPADAEEGENVGSVLAQTAENYQRFDTVSFSWAGGYTALGSPHVFFETETDDGFEPLILPDGRPLTDAGMETVLTYEASPDYATLLYPARRTHRYMITWELTADVPAGRYRIRVEGLTREGNLTVPYDAVSDLFEIRVSDALGIDDFSVQPLGGDEYLLSCDAFQPPNQNGYRLRHPDYGPDEWSPAAGGAALVTISVEGGVEETLVIEATDEGHFEGVFSLTQIGLAHSAQIEAGDLADGFGNVNEENSDRIVFP